MNIKCFIFFLLLSVRFQLPMLFHLPLEPLFSIWDKLESRGPGLLNLYLKVDTGYYSSIEVFTMWI